MPQLTTYKILKSRLFQHLAFWVFAFFLLAGFFAKEYGSTFLKLNLIYTGLFLLSVVLVVYLNLLILIPKFLQKGKWILYLVLLIPIVALGIFLNLLTFEYLSDWLFPGYYFISYYKIQDLFNFISIFLAATTLLKMAKGWFQVNEQKRKIDQLEKEKLDAELNALKSQINPHFLFNSLNSMYSLSLENDQKVPDLLLKLSAGMRYMLYETNENFVLLEKEIDYLNNYLDLQKLRTDQDTSIEFKIEGDIDQQKIAPLVLIPFVENAFKHGIKGDVENVFIKMSLKVKKEEIIFNVENNKGTVDRLSGEKYVGGVGLENVKKRMELLYQNQYNLKVDDAGINYKIQLKLPVR